MAEIPEHDRAGGRVLAIGLDAAESSLIKSLIDAGEMPAMKALLDRGTWSRVTGPTEWSSGCVWPNFHTGCQACDHGQYSIWNWDPAQMRLAYTDEERLTPFWKSLREQGTSVGVIDVPFSPFLGTTPGFDVHEWGAHSRVDGRVRISPGVAEEVAEGLPEHPFTDPLAQVPVEPDQYAGFLDECIEGVRLRGELATQLISREQPDLSLVIFEEAHHAGHFLWHTVEPELPMYTDLPPVAVPERTLADLYRELDRQVGRIVEAAGPETTVLVFALHGMGPSRGLPPVVEPLLEGLGMTYVEEGASHRSVLATVKKLMPGPLRDLYRKSVPLAKRSQWGQDSVMPAYDWSRTTAFALPIEQYGIVRINLAGREAEGIVPPEQYDQVCETLEKEFLALTTADGRPVVSDVARPPRGAHAAGLPDMIVHWHPAAFESPAVVNGVEYPNIRRAQTGQHRWDGFCIATGPAAEAIGDTIATEELHRVVVGALGR
ncbi:alkaline phosphatase family protein [Modestobacter marinus]|uniref:alkaline phosphatase family protein n=1 Tax=Modestobacter marinus TaxID=477641 RepID=UPI001C97E5D8|nr:alkaline phosphatase family protein [Modestobacter marinus]